MEIVDDYFVEQGYLSKSIKLIERKVKALNGDQMLLYFVNVKNGHRPKLLNLNFLGNSIFKDEKIKNEF